MTDSVVENESAEQPVQAPLSAASKEQLISMPVDRARTHGLQLTRRAHERRPGLAPGALLPNSV